MSVSFRKVNAVFFKSRYTLIKYIKSVVYYNINFGSDFTDDVNFTSLIYYNIAQVKKVIYGFNNDCVLERRKGFFLQIKIKVNHSEKD